MITLKDFMDIIDHSISDGYKYQWHCFGPNAHCISYHDLDRHVDISVVFDTQTQFVYEMEAWDGPNKREYRWIHPDYIKAVKRESKTRGVKFRQSYDMNKFTDLEVDEDIKEKARAIFLGEEYDTRVIMPLNMDQDELLNLMKLAHEADMTLNDFIAHILQQAIDKGL